MSALAPSVVPVIAIDGPSGSGKGTVSRAVARALGWHFLDSGALYRAVGLAAVAAGIDLNDTDALAMLAFSAPIRFEDLGESEPRIWLGDEDISHSIRGEQAAHAASMVAAQAPVRTALFERQRAFRAPPGLVADGRDMGTVVFTDADLKVFLTASAEERARRRHKQLSEKGIQAILPALLSEIEERDRRDTSRSVAPLKAAPDAHVIDSTKWSIEDVVSQVLEWATPLRG